MATRSISIELSARVQGFVAGMRTAQQAAQDFGNRTAAFARDNEQHLDRVGKAGMVMGGALLAGVGLAVKAAAEFDSAMSEVKASTHETAANMELLRQAAIDAGADTSFSAKEAAGAIDELAKAGVTTKEVLGGGLAGALSLAAAGSLEVGNAAEIAATAMTQFKLGGKDIPHVADLLAAGAGKAQGSVEDIGGALKQSGLVASQFGLSIEDTTGTLAAFASAGLIGSDSGTSLKTMLLALANPSKEAAEKMAELGIAAYDANGKFVGVTNLSGQLKTALSDQSQASRDAALSTIFGSDAIRAANVLYKNGADGISGWIDKVNESGFAAVTASMKQDNLAGDIEKLGGSFDSLLIKSGSGLSESLRGVVQGAEDLVDAVGKIPAPVMNATLGIAGVTGGALLLGGALLSGIPKLLEFHSSLNRIAPAGTRAGGALRGLGKAAGIAAAALIGLEVFNAIAYDKHTHSVEELGNALLKLNKSASGEGISALDTVLSDFGNFAGKKIGPDINSAADAIERITHPKDSDGINRWADQAFGWTGLAKSETTQVDDALKKVGEGLAGMAKNGSADAAAQSFKKLSDEFIRNGSTAQDALDHVPEYRDALLELANQSGVVLEGQDLLDFALGKVPASMQAAAGATQSYTDAAGQSVPVTEEMAKKLEDLGVTIQGRIADLEKFTQALFDAGLRTLDARDATAAHQEAIRNTKTAVEDATKAIQDNYVAQGYSAEAAKAMAAGQVEAGAALNKSKTDFDLTTEAGKILNDQFQSVARTGMAEIEAKAKAGAGQPELQKNLEATYKAMITAGDGMGLTSTAAEALTRKVLHIPPGVSVKSWMSDAAKRMAEQTAGAMNSIDGKTVNTYVNHHETTFIRTERSDSVVNSTGAAAGRSGTRTAHATGGAIIGPGTGTSDEIPALLSNGEHVLTAEEVRKMGGQAAVYRFRQMLDAGKLPKFATGGAAEKATARREFWLDYQRDSRRGNGYRTVSSSLSSAYSFADKLTQLADSGNVSAAAVRRLYDAAGQGEAGLRGLHGRADKLSASLDKAKTKLSDLTQVRDRIKGNLAGGFNIIDAVKQGNMYGTASMKDVTSGASSYLSRVQAFAGKLKGLQKKGYSGAIVQEIAELGLTEGSKAADVLLKATAGEVKQLNKTKTDIDTAAGKAGTYVTDAMYKGGIAGASAVVKGIESQQGAIGRAMLQIGLGMENALRSALGQKPIKRAGGGPVIGPGTGTSDEVPAWLSNGEHVLTAAEVQAMGGQAGVYRFRQHLASGYQYAPGHAPRVNVTAQQPTSATPVQQFGDMHFHEQRDPVATYHEFSRRTRRLST